MEIIIINYYSVAVILIVVCVPFASSQHIAVHRDYTTRDDRTHLNSMSRELVHTMQLRERQLLPLKEEHVDSIDYQVGLVIGIMREKYKRMMDIYIEHRRRSDGQNLLTGPGVWVIKPIHYLVAVYTLRMMEVEIYRYIDLLKKIPAHELADPNAGEIVKDSKPKVADHKTPAGPEPKMPQGPGPGQLGGRMLPESTTPLTNQSSTLSPAGFRSNLDQVLQNSLTEEDVKRQYREKYMKEHGGKEENWSLDHFYGFI